MKGKVFESEEAGFAGRAAARELYRELYFGALRELCDEYAEALTPELRTEMAGVCTLEPCCRRARRRRPRSRRDLSKEMAAVFEVFWEQLLPPE